MVFEPLVEPLVEPFAYPLVATAHLKSTSSTPPDRKDRLHRRTVGLATPSPAGTRPPTFGGKTTRAGQFPFLREKGILWAQVWTETCRSRQKRTNNQQQPLRRG